MPSQPDRKANSHVKWLIQSGEGGERKGFGVQKFVNRIGCLSRCKYPFCKRIRHTMGGRLLAKSEYRVLGYQNKYKFNR